MSTFRGLSLLANVFFLFVVFTSMPLVLATADNNMDFVLNAFAANYIIDLDDLSDGTEITLAAAGYTELGPIPGPIRRHGSRLGRVGGTVHV